MKKSYQKPALYAEKFQLVEHISGACDMLGRASYKDASSCNYDVGDGVKMFIGDANGCQAGSDPSGGQMNPEDFTGFDFQCEFNFSENAKLFAS